MFLLRMLGTWLLLAAMMALVWDGTRTIANGGELALTSLGAHWFNIHPPSLAGTQAAVQRYLHPVVWDPVFIRVLQLPAWFVLGSLGALLCLAGRRKQRLNVFTN